MEHNAFALINRIAEQIKPLHPYDQEAHQVAWWLLEAVTQKSNAELIAEQNIILDDTQEEMLQCWIDQHIHDYKPLQYIIGFVPFGKIKILVKPPVLIPRPETEEWCIRLIEQLKQIPNPSLDILDLCTGSGCIALALAYAFPQSHIVATDISEQALALAKENAELNNITNVTFIYSDLFAHIPQQKFDLIVANPPYISEDEWHTVSPMVRNWEDKHALVTKNDGLFLTKQIITQAPNWLRKNPTIQKYKLPSLVIEIGYTQGKKVQYFMQQSGFVDATIAQDSAYKDRVVMGRIINDIQQKTINSNNRH